MKFLSDILAKAGLTVDGVVTLNSVAQATVDTNKFVVIDNGVVKYRTGAEILSDIEAAPAVGSLNYIQNQTAISQNASYVISGSGKVRNGFVVAAPEGTLPSGYFDASIKLPQLIIEVPNAGDPNGRFELRVGGYHNNIWFGADALLNLDWSGNLIGNWWEGLQNAAFGVNAMREATTAYNSTAIGNFSLRFVTTGHHNAVLGMTSLFNVTTGSFNTAVGTLTGNGITTGNNNTIIGARVQGLPSDLSNNIIIADGAGNQRIRVYDTGQAQISNLAGTGSRMVVADNTGLLSTQAIPSLTGYVPYTGATQSVNLGEYGLTTGFITLDTTPTNTPTTQGTIYWDDSRSTAALIMNGTLQHIGQDQFYYVKNNTGTTIPKGTAVRFAGTDGASGHLLIAPFLANGTFLSTYFMGVTSEAIPNGGFGQVISFGELTGVDTSTYVDGDILYASTSVSGGFQTTVPIAPNNIVQVAAVIRAGNNGTIVVRPTLGSKLTSDESVRITSVANGNVLQYNSSLSVWENVAPSTLAVSNLYTANGTLSGNRTVTSGGYSLTFTGSNTASSGVSRGLNLTHTLVAAANNDVLVQLDIAPTFTNGSFTGVLNIPLRINSAGTVFRNDTGLGHSSIDFFFLSTNTYGFNNRIGNTSAGSAGSAALGLWDGSRINGLFGHAGNNANLGIAIGGTQVATWFSTGNLMLGETTDRGFRLHVEGNLNVSSSIRLNGGAVASNTGSDLEIGKTLSYSQTSIYGNTALGIVVSNTGTVRLANLAGTGDRMVIASSTGLLSTQAIPTLANLGAQAQLNGTGFVRMSGTTVNYDTTVFVTGDYYAPNAVFGQRPLRSQIVDNVLYQADSRFNVTRTDNGARIGNSLFNGNYDQGGFTIAAGTTLTFNLNFTANGNSSVTYTEGLVYLHFYYTSVPQSVSGRVKDSGGIWRNITNWTNISLSGGLAVWRGSVPGFNYMTDMEITITAQASINTQFNQWEYVQSRPGQFEWGIISKLQANNLWTNLTFRNATNTSVITLAAGTGNITANAFIKTGGTSAQFLKADGSVDTNTYLTTNLYNSNGTLSGNRTVTSGGFSVNYTGSVFLATAGGTVGIGTTSPSYNLHVQAAAGATTAVKATNTTTRALTEWESYTSANVMMRGFVGTFHDNSAFQVRTETSHPITFSTTNSERMRIFAGGNIGINTTTDAGFRFDVNGTSIFRNSLTVNYGTINRTTQITDTGFYISRTSDGTYSGSIVGDGHMTFGTRNYYAFNTNGTERFRIHENGNVTIGTTSDAGYKFDVNGTTRLNGNVNTVGTIINNVAANSLSQLGILTSPTGNQTFTLDLGYTNNANRIRSSYVFVNFTAELGFGNTTGIFQRLGNSDTGWSLASAGADTKQVVLANNNTTGGSILINNNSATVIAINSSNNVGIGTTSPGTKLDVVGAIRTNTGIYLGGNADRILASSNNGVMEIGSNQPIVFNNASTLEYARFLANGRLGIGTTAPGTLVELAATSTNAASLTLNAQGTGNSTIRHFRGNVFKFEVGPGGGSDDYLIYNSGTSGYSLRIKNDATGNIFLGESAGNLFVGTTTASTVYTTAKLVLNSANGNTYQEIRGTSQSTLALTTGTSVGATPAVEIYNSYNFGIKFSQTSESSFLMFYHGTDKYLRFDTNSAERMRITSAGDVGIGTTTPGAKLHVDYTPTWSSNGRITYYGALRQTIPAGSSLNSGYTVSASVSYLETTLEGSSTISAGSLFGGFIGINRIGFTTGGTLTINTAAGGHLRAYAAMQVFMQTGGTNAGTVTHGASLFVQGIYPINATVVTFTNYYGLLINDLTEWGTVAITNRWGIYQAGANDRNYFAGDTTFNKLAGSGTRMVVVDANGLLSTQAIPSGGGGGITTLNTLTAATQTFAVGTSGTDFNISSSTSTHTFNIPDASLTARGLVTTGAQTISGNKIIRGTSTLNTEFAFTVQNSSGTNLFQVRNDNGAVFVNSELRAIGNLQVDQITTRTTGNVSFPANISLGDTKNLIVGTTTGAKIGTATNQKLGFWNATPIVQPTTAVAAAAFVANTGTAVNDASTFDGYTMRQVVKALRNIGLLA